MSAKRITVAILTVTILCAAHSLAATTGSGAGQQPAANSSSGPSLGKWEFTGKDNTGVAWTGALTIEKLDPDRFDTNKYHSMCNLDVQSSSSGRGVGAPCRYDPSTRAVSFSTGTMASESSYTAVLSPDGKSLAGGKWTESKKDDRKSGQSGVTVVKTGDWSAKLTAR
jgi:hypothetical protein